MIPIPTRKLKYLRFSSAMLIKTLTNSMIMDKVINPLPEDTKWVRSGTDSFGNVIFVVESEEWELIGEGQEIPYYGDMIFQRASFGKGKVQ